MRSEGPYFPLLLARSRPSSLVPVRAISAYLVLGAYDLGDHSELIEDFELVELDHRRGAEREGEEI